MHSINLKKKIRKIQIYVFCNFSYQNLNSLHVLKCKIGSVRFFLYKKINGKNVFESVIVIIFYSKYIKIIFFKKIIFDINVSK